MARIRTIKPKIVHDAALTACSYPARWLFVAMIAQADDYGRLHGTTGAIRGMCLPNDDETLQQVDGWLGELSERALIQRYSIGAEQYVQLVSWEQNQRVDKPGQELIPAPRDDIDAYALDVHNGSRDPRETLAQSSRDSRETLAQSSRLEEGSRRKEEGGRKMEEGRRNSSSDVSNADVDSIAECEHLAGWLVKNGSKRPTITSRWLRDAERMRRIDGRTHEQVMAAIDWCQQDAFWRSNILSMTKLREKYDQLRLSAGREPAKPTGSDIRAAIARGEA